MDLTRTTAAILTSGIAIAGLLIGGNLSNIKRGDRYVDVKGVAERDAKADVALWPLRVVAAGNDLSAVQDTIVQETRQVLSFLKRHGVDSSTVTLQSLEVTDAYANVYVSELAVDSPVRRRARYSVQQTLMVRSEDVDVIAAASTKVGELVKAGVAFSSGRMGWGPSGGPTYLYTKLNDVKPAMIREATAAARTAAEQFAADSHTQLGGIRVASQGMFVILARDQAQGVSEETQVSKRIRVVSTVQYYLK